MTTWVAFLRAVNVGKRQYPMAQLRAALTAAGFEEVETHIQTGNVRLRTRMRSRERVVAALEAAMLADRGFEVPVVLLSPDELAQVVADADAVVAEHGEPGWRQYVELLARQPDEADVAMVEAGVPGARALVRPRAVHLLYDVPFGQAKPPRAAVTRALGISTNRNVTVLRTLSEKWSR
ncbi:DUF1697 domain-containing protein [Nocardioides aurantiacus]|uniref:DUF1697 domain-containing protein n=1 Tax=Nocardioides aurantiacus TaxID=86796 RepID=UPI00403F1CB2